MTKGGFHMSYEELLIEVEEEGIMIFENNYIGRLKGLYVDNTVTLNTNIETESERKCILAEELGHHHTSYGDIRDQSKIENRKQEQRARAWGYERLVGIIDLVNAFKHGVKNRYELAEYLNVTEEFIDEVIAHYKLKYGLFYKIDNYVLYFEPLSVLEVWE